MAQQPPRPCVFCKKSNVKLTREHVIPQWISRLLGTPTIQALSLHDSRPREWQMTGLDHQVKAVCSDCNSGWMSDLEGAVQPLLTPLILGEPQYKNIGEERQILIAAWALKTALMIEQTARQQLVLPTTDHAHLFQHRKPTAGSLIMLATDTPKTADRGLLIAMTMQTSVHNVIRDEVGKALREDLTERYQAGLVMFSINHLVVTVLSHNFPGELQVDTLSPFPDATLEDHFKQVWPAANRRLQWPPRQLGEVGGFEGVFNSWRNG